ncbi:acylphosphatase [Candidatus Woesearchaeota archaeon]|nr:acylphosphatase [Candidatus Woesearchaeota archaeon]
MAPEERLVVSGRVQGVGFRYFARHAAGRLGVRGWVRNRGDGRVEIACQGDERDIRAFIVGIRRGPLLARVDGVAVERRDSGEQYRGFEIRR